MTTEQRNNELIEQVETVLLGMTLIKRQRDQALDMKTELEKNLYDYERDQDDFIARKEVEYERKVYDERAKMEACIQNKENEVKLALAGQNRALGIALEAELRCQKLFDLVNSQYRHYVKRGADTYVTQALEIMNPKRVCQSELKADTLS